MSETRLEGFRGESREMHEAICSECGNMTKVPFKPDGIRPIYCRDCFNKSDYYGWTWRRCEVY